MGLKREVMRGLCGGEKPTRLTLACASSRPRSDWLADSIHSCTSASRCLQNILTFFTCMNMECVHSVHDCILGMRVSHSMDQDAIKGATRAGMSLLPRYTVQSKAARKVSYKLSLGASTDVAGSDSKGMPSGLQGWA